jgi:hypothetical protein
MTNQLFVHLEDPDSVRHQHEDAGPAVLASDCDVVQPALVAQRDVPRVDLVLTHPAVRRSLHWGELRLGLCARPEGMRGCLSVERPVRPHAVVVLDELVQLLLQRLNRPARRPRRLEERS